MFNRTITMTNKFFIRILLLFCVISISQSSYSQVSESSDAEEGSTNAGKSNLIISGTLFDDGTRLEDVIVSIKPEGGPESEEFSDAGGKFKISFELDLVYMMYFKKEGYVDKMVEVDTRNIPSDNRKFDFYYKGWKVDMFPSDLEVDFSALKMPVAKVVFNPADDGFSTDKKYERVVRPRREKLIEDVYAAYDDRDSKEEGAFDDYMLAVKDGDLFLKEGDYENAMMQYEAAKHILPRESYPDKQIKKTLALMNANQSVDEQYANVLATADEAFDNKNWETARENYEEAEGIKPKMEYPKDQIDLIVKNIAAEKLAAMQLKEKEKLDLYNGFVAKGDSLLAAKSFTNSKVQYNKALEVMSKEYPKSKIKEINGILAQSEKSEKAYLNLLANANKFMSEKKYAQAKETYANALGVKPEAEEPKLKMKEIDGLLAGLAAMKELEGKLAAKKEADLKAQYEGIIFAADALMVDKEYVKAKAEYERALGLKPNDIYPKDQIALINNTLSKMEGLDIQYSKLMSDAVKNRSVSKWEFAKSNYQAALELKPSEQSPKDGIAEMDAKLGAIAAKEDAEKMALENKYTKFISDSDAEMLNENYANAKAGYEKALVLKPKENYPKDQIAIANAKMLAIQGADKQYSKLMADAEKDKSLKKWELARANYVAASEIKPNEQAPKDGMAFIDSKLATINADAAAKRKALEDNYNTYLATADGLMESKDYLKAKGEYEKALNLKPKENYPKEQITKANSSLAQIEGVEKQYGKWMADALKNKSSTNWNQARSNYMAASELKPKEQAPKDGIAEMDKKLASMAAAAEAKQKAINDRYAGFVADGDAMMTLEKYDDAQKAYKEALTVKSQADYPKTQLAIIEDRLKGMAIAAAASENEAKELAAKELAYSQSIGTADQLYKTGSLSAAKAEYKNALSIYSGKAYPVSQMAEIDAKLEEIAASDAAAAEELAMAKAKENSYSEIIVKADAAFAKNDFVSAQLEYQNAQKVFSDRPYPANQIKKMEALELAAMRKAEKEALAVAQLEENTKRFNEIVAEGDAFVSANNLQKGKFKYEAALKLFPGDASVTAKMRSVVSKMEEARKMAAFHAKNDTEFNRKLAVDYPNGLNETTKKGTKTTTRIIVVANNRGDEYKKEVYSYGAIFYFKNGKKVDESTFTKETKGH